MKYYIECTVLTKNPLMRHSYEDFIDLPSPWVDVDPTQMTDEWAENRLMSGYWAAFDPATPAPRRWYETDNGRDENNEYYTLLVYPVKGNAEDPNQIDWDTIVAGASMDAWDIWQARIDTFKDCVYDYVCDHQFEFFGEDGDISYKLTDIEFAEVSGELSGCIEFPGDKDSYIVVDRQNSGTIELFYGGTKS